MKRGKKSLCSFSGAAPFSLYVSFSVFGVFLYYTAAHSSSSSCTVNVVVNVFILLQDTYTGTDWLPGTRLLVASERL